jgi:hypothetical protein
MLLRSLGSGGIHRTSRICLVSWLSVASTPCVGRPSARSTSRSLAAILTLMGCFSSWYSSAHHCMILGTCDAAKAAACNRTARSAIVTALLGRLGGLFRRSIDILDTYYGIQTTFQCLRCCTLMLGPPMPMPAGPRKAPAGFLLACGPGCGGPGLP